MVDHAKEREKHRRLLKVIREALDDFQRFHDLLFAFRFSASVCTTPYLIKKIGRYSVTSFVGDEADLKEIREEEKAYVNDALSILNEERKKSFIYLFEQASVNMYTILEATIKSTVTAYLQTDSDLLSIKAISSIKIPFIEFKNLNELEQIDYLFDQYEKNVAAGLKYGVNRFEALLEPIGLSSQTDKEVNDSIYELAQIRNCLLHRGGKIDKKLVDACPWYASLMGQRVVINDRLFNKFNHGVTGYISSLLQRISLKAP